MPSFTPFLQDISDNLRATAQPLCPVFGLCGGCQYQDVSYERQLEFKQEGLRALLRESCPEALEVLAPIVPSPSLYGYRSRLDMKLLKTRAGDIFLGFSPEAGRGRVVPTGNCAIAMPALSEFIPELKKQAAEKLPSRYRIASLVVKTGDDGRVAWGGIGRRSLRMNPEDYFWTDLRGQRIFYSLDTFFQANLSILPALMEYITATGLLDKKTRFFDLYGGVGLFSVALADLTAGVVLIEENIHAVQLAAYNFQYNGLENFTLVTGRVEDHLEDLLQEEGQQSVAMIDPPRKGLDPRTIEYLGALSHLERILYLSCNPQALVRDLVAFERVGRRVERIVPFDFFPQTKHLETLAVLRRRSGLRK